jgi:hypothetical protein
VLQRANGGLVHITIGVSYWFHREVRTDPAASVHKLIFKENSPVTRDRDVH